jgi:3-deoxy-D-manno-octulosonate 8-phosphate phosphatase (KDO 8-P phosphatase)
MSFNLQGIKLILCDVDGVLTNGEIIYTGKKVEIKKFNVQDGLGFAMARWAGLKTGILTSRNSNVVALRAKQLEIDVISQGKLKKMPEYVQIREGLGISNEEVCYIGDDIIDIPVLRAVGFGVAVANAREEVKKECDYVTNACGGEGAVREVVDLILKQQNKFDMIVSQLTESE